MFIKTLIATLCLCYALAYAQSPTAVLSQLGAKGVTDIGGTTNYAGYLPRLGADGKIASTMAPSVTFDRREPMYVIDPVYGVDISTYNGTIFYPYRTMQFAITNGGATNMPSFILLPGAVHSSVVVDTSAYAGLTNISILGLSASSVGIGDILYSSTGGGSLTPPTITLDGVRVSGTVGQYNNRFIHVRLKNESGISVLHTSHTNAYLYFEPNTYVTSFDIVGSVSTSYLSTASALGYTSTLWTNAPATVKAALDSLYTRAVPVGTNGCLMYWSDAITNWSLVAAGSTNDVLVGGATPGFTNSVTLSLSNHNARITEVEGRTAVTTLVLTNVVLPLSYIAGTNLVLGTNATTGGSTPAPFEESDPIAVPLIGAHSNLAADVGHTNIGGLATTNYVNLAVGSFATTSYVNGAIGTHSNLAADVGHTNIGGLATTNYVRGLLGGYATTGSVQEAQSSDTFQDVVLRGASATNVGYVESTNVVVVTTPDRATHGTLTSSNLTFNSSPLFVLDKVGIVRSGGTLTEITFDWADLVTTTVLASIETDPVLSSTLTNGTILTNGGFTFNSVAVSNGSTLTAAPLAHTNVSAYSAHPGTGSASTNNSSDFATSAQGLLAASALQPDDPAFGPSAGVGASGSSWGAFGYGAGGFASGDGWHAFGFEAGQGASGNLWHALGYGAGTGAAGNGWYAIGTYAGISVTGAAWTAIGTFAGMSAIQSNSFALGSYAGQNARGNERGYIDVYPSNTGYSANGATNDRIFLDNDGKLYLGRGEGAPGGAVGGVLRGTWTGGSWLNNFAFNGFTGTVSNAVASLTYPAITNVVNTTNSAGIASITDGVLSIGTNVPASTSSSSGGVTNHTDLTTNSLNANADYQHLTMAQVSRIPPQWITGTNMIQALRVNGTNAYWVPVYDGRVAAYDQVSTYGFTGSNQVWTVPTNVSRVLCKLWGGGGGGQFGSSSGGNAGFASVIIPVQTSDQLLIQVGGGGPQARQTTTRYAWPDGGVSWGMSGGYSGGAGGGSSRVWLISGGVTSLWAVAAGGGGAMTGAGTAIAGSAGGGSTGASGLGGTTVAAGGSQSSGGAGGTIVNGTSGADGAYLQGGAAASNSIAVGGGGGGGYYGGGGGCSPTNAAAGGSGAGGSCYVNPLDLSGYVTRSINSDDPDYTGTVGVGGSAGTGAGNAGSIIIKWGYDY